MWLEASVRVQVSQRRKPLDDGFDGNPTRRWHTHHGFEVSETATMVLEEDGDEGSEAKGHPDSNLRTAVILVAAQVPVEEIAVDRHGDGQDRLCSYAPHRLQARIALAERGIAAAVADAADTGLPGRRNWHQPWSEWDQ